MSFSEYTTGDKAIWMSGRKYEQDRIIKIIEDYGNPSYAEAWRPEIEEACNRLIALIKGEK